MKKISLRWKIAFITFIPFLFFAVLALYQMNGILGVYQDASQISKKVLLYSKASPLAHQLQIERGMSANFASGGVNEDKLKQQWRETDQRIADFRNVLETTTFSENFKQDLIQYLNEHLELRKNVIAKTLSMGNVIGKYKILISRLFQIGLDGANETNLTRIAIGLRSHAALEEVKDNTGLLRAGMTNVLSSKQEILPAVSENLLALKGSVDSTLMSKTLVLDTKGNEFLNTFKQSNEWAEIVKALNDILKNGNKENLGIDPSDFFKKATFAIDKLGALIDYQTSFLVDVVNETLIQSERELFYMGLSLILASVLISGLVFKMVSSINKSLRIVANNLKNGSKHVANASRILEKNAVVLLEASNVQASSLHQTAAAIDEINAMVVKNSDAVQTSKDESAKSQQASTRGKQTVEEMLRSIQEIGKSNNEIMKQMEESNKEFSEIAKVIATIGEKTKIINEIVFQTKLLSFNASVEAARAGEHGNGFSVVASEIGSLASMSGKAAEEISKILTQSIAKVDNIISNTQSRINVLVENGKDKLITGINTAEKCDLVLDEILKNVSKVDSMVFDIATASKEQSRGVQEITSAMSQLDLANQQNTTISQDSTESATQLNKQAAELEHVASELITFIEGDSLARSA